VGHEIVDRDRRHLLHHGPGGVGSGSLDGLQVVGDRSSGARLECGRRPILVLLGKAGGEGARGNPSAGNRQLGRRAWPAPACCHLCDLGQQGSGSPRKSVFEASVEVVAQLLGKKRLWTERVSHDGTIWPGVDRGVVCKRWSRVNDEGVSPCHLAQIPPCRKGRR
jgi:hypothetical protein